MFAKATAGVIAFAVFIAFFGVVFGGWFTVEQGERVIVTTNGAVSYVAGPGMHLKMPFFQSTARISIQQNVDRWACVKDSQGGMRALCDPNKDHIAMQAYSQDQQPADLRVSVNWHVPEAEIAEVYTNYGTLEALADKIIGRKAPQAVKTVFGQYNAVRVIQERAGFNAAVAEAVKAIADGPVIIDSVQVENIDFSDAYEQTVEARMVAQVEVQKREQELAQKKIEAQITVTQAQAQADSQLAVAKANAEAVRITGEATASAIKARAAALADNPLLVQLTASERWNGVLPSTMLPGSAVPFISVVGTK